mgnify:FL=1
MNKPMRCLDLFSGIGGFSLGLERAGIETVAFCEYDKKCRKVLQKHWPEVPQFNDVRTLTGEQLERRGITTDLICAGMPCQPYSRGNWLRKGRGDIRDMSGEAIRLVREIEPAIFIGENTEGFLDIGYDAFADDLENEGYSCEAISIPSCAVGLPTLERHVWIIASTSGKRLQRYVEKTMENIEALSWKLQRGDTGVGGRWDLSRPRVHRSGERVSGRMDRNKQLGNAVDPVVIEQIGRAIIEVENESSTEKKRKFEAKK